MAKPKDLTDKKFGKLTCIRIKKERTKNGHVQWICKCECGRLTAVLANNLSRGNSRSCGKCCNRSRTHGMSSSKLYKVWSSMKYRCLSPNDPSYYLYGGKGVSVCEEWLKFEGFLNWAKKSGYKPGLTLERKDSNGDYCPKNCSWIPKGKQSENTSRCKIIEHDGKKMIMKHWAEYLGVPYSLLQSRITQRKWPVDKALITPPRSPNRCNVKLFSCNGMTLSIAEWARHLNLNEKTLYNRLYKGSTIQAEIERQTGKPCYVAAQ